MNMPPNLWPSGDVYPENSLNYQLLCISDVYGRILRQRLKVQNILDTLDIRLTMWLIKSESNLGFALLNVSLSSDEES